MATLYPRELSNTVRRDPKRKAEITLYDSLKTQLVGKDWKIFYSVAWLGLTKIGGIPRDGETDFIIGNPKFGVLIIEVKGGRISYEGDLMQWYTTDRYGNRYKINPFIQARNCKYALINKLKSVHNKWKLKESQDIPLYYSVAFPDTSVKGINLPSEAPPEIILDSNDLSNLPYKIEKIFTYYKGKVTNNVNYMGGLLIDIEKMLAPNILLRNPLFVTLREEEQDIIKLTEEQFQLLNFLSRHRRATIKGCAGSGKTMLAVEKAKRLANEGFKTLLTCYNRPLANFLQTSTKNIPNLDTYTFHQLCQVLAETAKIPLPDITSGEKQHIFEDVYPEILMKAISENPEFKYDAIIVDEGQDLQETWWIALEDCLKEGKESVLYVFFDDNQKIYSKSNRMPIDLEPFVLSYNVRNTRAIHKVLSLYYQSEGKTCARGPSGRVVEIYKYTTNGQLIKELSKILHKLIETENIPSEDIVVLTPKSMETSVLKNIKLESGYKLVNEQINHSKEIYYSTINRFKGLERSVVIVVELDKEFLSKEKEKIKEAICYVAFSRPRHHLILLGTDEIQTLLPNLD